MNKKETKSLDNIDSVDEFDTFTFAEGDEAAVPDGKCIAEFNFNDSNADINISKAPTSLSNSLNEIKKFDSNFNKSLIPTCHGSIPSINDEVPDTKRCYILRSSTVRKLNEIKNNHSSLNVCISTIVDLAVDYYYDCLLNNHI